MGNIIITEQIISFHTYFPIFWPIISYKEMKRTPPNLESSEVCKDPYFTENKNLECEMKNCTISGSILSILSLHSGPYPPVCN